MGNSLGSYNLAEATGQLVSPAADFEFFQFRNSTANLVVVEEVLVGVVVESVAVSAGSAAAYISRATGWTGQGTLGTALDVRPKRRTAATASSMAAGDIRISTTATLGAGTKTVEGAKLVIAAFSVGAIGTGGTIDITGAPSTTAASPNYPFLVLQNNEGFVIRNLSATTTGTIKYTVTVMWRETT